MDWKRKYFNGLLMRLVLILGIGLLFAKAAVEDGGDGRAWALGILIFAGTYLTIALGIYFRRKSGIKTDDDA